MDFLQSLAHKQQSGGQGQQHTGESSGGGGGGLMGSLNNMAGGGKRGEEKEDYLDKAVDFVQERMGGGPQDNESAMEQFKDEQISDAIRDQYKKLTGKEFPIPDKS